MVLLALWQVMAAAIVDDWLPVSQDKAAERAHEDYLVTSDKQLIQKATVPALTPADMTALLETRAQILPSFCQT